MKAPTQEQIKEIWKWCGWHKVKPANIDVWFISGACDEYWKSPNGDKIARVSNSFNELPPIDLNNLFKYAMPVVLPKLESRFTDPEYNRIRALEILFAKWIEKIKEGYSFEEALFWAIWEVIK